LISTTIATYGRIDVLVYNSGAIWWASVEKTPFKRFQLMQQVNVEGLYGTIQAVLPQFEKQGWKGRIVVVSPPIYSRFFRGKTAYAMGKVGMSVLTKGLAMDWEREGKKDIAITSIWPAAAIQSAATQNVEGDNLQDLRKPTIFSDAILEVLRSDPLDVNGCLELDEDFLRKRGYRDKDFEKYSLVPGAKPRRIMPKELPDLRVAEQDDEGKRVDSTKLRAAKL
jgi:NAD(P)-dependent dehydrogenase (short-subunit alcohol dehydrogenase family)